LILEKHERTKFPSLATDGKDTGRFVTHSVLTYFDAPISTIFDGVLDVRVEGFTGKEKKMFISWFSYSF